MQRSDVGTGENVAVKLEPVSGDPPFLNGEADIYRALPGGTGTPRVYRYDIECEYIAMVLELLGPVWKTSSISVTAVFTRKTALMLADQLNYRLQYIPPKQMKT